MESQSSLWQDAALSGKPRPPDMAPLLWLDGEARSLLQAVSAEEERLWFLRVVWCGGPLGKAAVPKWPRPSKWHSSPAPPLLLSP